MPEATVDPVPANMMIDAKTIPPVRNSLWMDRGALAPVECFVFLVLFTFRVPHLPCISV
jgi:hypothetical protein